MSEEPIKWISIQPLTGGMYIGAYKAIGHHADCIISFDGLCTYTEKDGQITKAANEYNLRKWLEKNNAKVPYYRITNRKMFDTNIQMSDVNLVDDDNNTVSPDFHGVDIVVAVPVCAGLSTVTRCSTDVKTARNCNMQCITYYTLNVIKPKMFCFENAASLVSTRGNEIRSNIESIAAEAGYSVLYYKTNTALHHNCQHRIRTFVIFTKLSVLKTSPVFNFENETIKIPEFFESISKNASQQTPVESFIQNYTIHDFMQYKYGDKWIDALKGKHNIVAHVLKNNLFDEFFDYVNNSDKYTDAEKKQSNKYYYHVIENTSQGRGYYGPDLCIYDDYFPAVMFKSIWTTLHYKGERFCTIRELLSLMGMPEDFVLYGTNKLNVREIGQNVPVNTAKFIVSQMVNLLKTNKITENDFGTTVLFQDNTKQVTCKL